LFGPRLFLFQLLQAPGHFGALEFAIETAFAELGKDVEQTDEIAGIFLDFFAQGGTVEIGQKLAQLGGGKLEKGFMEFIIVLSLFSCFWAGSRGARPEGS